MWWVVSIFSLRSVHSWKPVSSGTEREMRFSRPEQDGVERRVVSPQSMEEWFRCRDDFLCFRQVIFSLGGWSSTLSPQKSGLEDLNVLVRRKNALMKPRRPILDFLTTTHKRFQGYMSRLVFIRVFQKVVERFSRNPSKAANADVAQRVFLVPEMQTELTYHLMDHRTIPSRRSFTKPEGGDPLTRDMFSSFQVLLRLFLGLANTIDQIPRPWTAHFSTKNALRS